jgi:heat shock protein HslJ
MKPIRHISTFLLLFFCLNFSNTKAQTINIKRFIIADAKTACIFENSIMACYKIKNHPDSSWKDFPYPIEGFLYEQGYETEIDVEETIIDFPGDTIQKRQYKLIRIINKVNKVITDLRVLTNNEWTFINMAKSGNVTPLRKANANIIFNIEEKKVNGFSGCNQFSGNAKFENGVIDFGMLISTKMACDKSSIETIINEGLTGKAAFYVRNNMLYLICENNTSLHLKPKKRLDSILNVINNPEPIYSGNHYALMENKNYQLKLSGFPEFKDMLFEFKTTEINEKDKVSIDLRLSNIDKDNSIAFINILKLPHPEKNTKYADVIFKDGTKKRILITEVL